MTASDSTRKCPQCGGPVTAKDPRTKFCSHKCWGLAKRTHDHAPVRNCEQCGGAFAVKQPRRRVRFCSVSCASRYNRALRPPRPKPTKPCKWCGEPYEYDYRSNRETNFCSLKCSGQWKKANVPTFGFPSGEGHYNWRGGIAEAKRGPNWPWVRKQALKRDRNTCQDCGRAQSELNYPLEVHHIIPFGFFGMERYEEANELPNLVTLCNPCHDERDKHKDRLFR